MRHDPLAQAAPAGARPTQTQTPGQPHCLDSQALLCGQKSVVIVHQGASYRLQATRLGKLILTK